MDSQRIKLQLAGLVDGATAFVCLGNRDRGDDALALEFADDLKPINPDRVFSEEEGLEDVMLRLRGDSTINRVLFLDACDSGAKPGSISIHGIDAIEERLTTHKAPLSISMALLEKAGKTTYLIGIQPRTLELGAHMSDEVRSALDLLEEIAEKTLHQE